MVVTFNPAISSIRTYDVAFGNSEKIQPKKAEITSQELNAGKCSIGRASHWFHNAAAGLLFITAALFGGCAKDETPAPVNPPVDPPVTELSATQKTVAEFQNAQWGTGTKTKSVTSNPQLLDSLAYEEIGSNQIEAYKYDYTNPDTVKIKRYFTDQGFLTQVGDQKTWKEADGKLITVEQDGPTRVTWEYTKDSDGKVLETYMGNRKCKYIPAQGDTVIKQDIKSGYKRFFKVLARTLKK